MRLKTKSQIQVMRKSSTLPEALGTRDGGVVFRLYVDVDATAAIKNNILFLDYEISPVDVVKITSLKFSNSDSNKIYQLPSARNEKMKRDKELIIYSGSVDITKYLPNDKIREIGSGSPVKKTTVIRPSNSQNSINSIAPRSGATTNIVPSASVSKKTYKTIAEYRKKDPAQELNARPSHSSIFKSVSGLRTTGNYQKIDLQFEAARIEMQKRGNTPSLIEKSERATNFITVPLEVTIPESKVKNYSFTVKARKEAAVVHKIDQTVDFSKALKDAVVPSISPNISVASFEGKRKIKIKQIDPRASKVKIYRKTLNKDNFVDDSYELVADLDASSGDEFNIADPDLSPQQTIYRAVSYDSYGRTFGEFSSAVIGKSKISQQKNVEDPVTIFAYETANGVQVSVHNIPYGVVAIRLVRRNVTTKEKAYSTPTSLSEKSQKSIDNETTTASFLDRVLRPDTVLEYKVMMTDTRGNVYESQRSSIIHFVGSKSVEESKSLISQDYRVESDGTSLTVSFQVDVSSSKTTIEQVYNILVSSGLDSQYIEEIKSNRELLNKITALEVVRFDCTTGHIENFGIVESGRFEDSSRTRSVYNVSNIVPGRKYVYFARLLVRSPGSIFSQTNVGRTDVETGKSFSTNLKKYNSPKTLKKGVLPSNVIQKRAVSATGLASDPSSSTDDEMIAGMTSTTIAVNVDVPRKDAEVKNLSVRKTQRGNEISWILLPNDRKIDHVIVHADYNGVLAPLRAVHFDKSESMMFVDELLASEPNQPNYYIQVVYTNYDMGSIIGPARRK